MTAASRPLWFGWVARNRVSLPCAPPLLDSVVVCVRSRVPSCPDTPGCLQRVSESYAPASRTASGGTAQPTPAAPAHPRVREIARAEARRLRGRRPTPATEAWREVARGRWAAGIERGRDRRRCYGHDGLSRNGGTRVSSNGRDWWPVCAGCIPDGWPRRGLHRPARTPAGGGIPRERGT